MPIQGPFKLHNFNNTDRLPVLCAGAHPICYHPYLLHKELSPGSTGRKTRCVKVESGAPGKIRTPDPLIRSQVLYPAELPVRVPPSRSFVLLACSQ